MSCGTPAPAGWVPASLLGVSSRPARPAESGWLPQSAPGPATVLWAQCCCDLRQSSSQMPELCWVTLGGRGWGMPGCGPTAREEQTGSGGSALGSVSFRPRRRRGLQQTPATCRWARRGHCQGQPWGPGVLPDPVTRLPGGAGGVGRRGRAMMLDGLLHALFSGLKTFLSHHCYEGTVSFLPARHTVGSPRDRKPCRAG